MAPLNRAPRRAPLGATPPAEPAPPAVVETPAAPVSGLDAPPVTLEDAAAAEAEGGFPDAYNDPVKEYIFLPGKGHTSSQVAEFIMMAVFQVLSIPAPEKGALRFVKIREEYARALSDEAGQWLRQLQAQPPAVTPPGLADADTPPAQPPA